MKLLTLISLFFALNTSLAFAGQTACPQFFVNGQGPEYLNNKVSAKTRELCNSGYAVGHSGQTRTALWAAERITRERLEAGRGLPRANDFRPDDRLPASERAELSDFARSGLDRGHLVSAADSASPLEQHESFLLSNMVGQDPDNNRHLFEGTESAIRKEAKRVGELFVITGPMFLGQDIKALKGRVLIPTALYKCLYYPRAQKGGCFVETNGPGMEYNVASISEVEKAININLFPGVSQSVKDTAIQLPTPIPHSKHGR